MRIKMGTELFSPEVVNTVVDTGKTLISSPAVQGVVSALITTLFVRRGEDIKAMEALKAKELEKVIEELLKTGRLSYVELYKCNNFLKIAKRADEMMSICQGNLSDAGEGENEEQDKFSFDWLMRFFDAVGNISNENVEDVYKVILDTLLTIIHELFHVNQLIDYSKYNLDKEYTRIIEGSNTYMADKFF